MFVFLDDRVSKLVSKPPKIMAFQKTPSYLYRKATGGNYHLKLPIPPGLRYHFPDAMGKPRTHISETLGTAREAEAEQLKRPRLTHYWAMFKRLESGGAAMPTATQQERLQGLREATAEAQAENRDDDDAGVEALRDAAQSTAEELEATIGTEAAVEAYRVAMTPEGLTLREAVAQWNAGGSTRASTQYKRGQAVDELLGFLRVDDCLPSYVTEGRAVAYVNWLNAGKASHSTKQDRISNLHGIWLYLVRRRKVQRSDIPWIDHEVTARSTGSAHEPGKRKRKWEDSEFLTLFNAPDDGRIKSAHYTRALFRELYTLGMTTGMRLDEIVNLSPSTVTAIDGNEWAGDTGYWLNINKSKTEAGVREIPVVHSAAVAVLRARLNRQHAPGASIFSECRPGGPDNKLSWHVQKAMGRDRKRLGFGSEVDFHSTRRCFMTMIDDSELKVVHIQRYVGHQIPTVMHAVYIKKAVKASLLRVARAVRYAPEVEEAMGREGPQPVAHGGRLPALKMSEGID